jgi:dephospho-CoA kinase
MSNSFNYVIGLTGNIACGKSTVVAELQRLGAHTIDADAVTRQLQQPGQEVFARIVAHFGHEILTADGTLDRRLLGQRVFADASQLRTLEAIVHPAVRQHIMQWLQALPTGTPQTPVVAVIDAIKLIESGWPQYCNAVWVVTSPRHVQIARLQQTRGLSEAEAILRIDAQSPQQLKVAAADVVIDNGGLLADTLAQVHTAWQHVQANFAQ